MGLEYRREDRVLQPAREQLLVGGLDACGQHVSADVVTPVAVAYVRVGRGEVGQERQTLPCGEDVARECRLVSVRAQSAPAMIDHRPFVGRELAVAEKGVVEPERIAYRRHILALLPLLPVEPPEVDALPLQRVQDGLEVAVGPLLLAYAERYGLARFLPAVVLGEVVVGSLVGLYARCRVEIERYFQVAPVRPADEVLGRGEQLAFPRVARPADALAVLVALGVDARQTPRVVPLHVDYQNVDRYGEALYLLDQPHQLVVGVLPVAAPPVAEGILGRQGLTSADAHVVGHGGGVVVAVCHDIPVDAVALAAFGDPPAPAGVVVGDDRAGALVEDDPAVARYDAGVERLVEVPAVGAVERAHGALQVALVLHAGAPYYLAAVHRELDR